ncbi:hypothetical protein D3C80_1459380 [compost metagenome]
MLKKPVTIARVGPTRMMKPSNRMASTMLISDRRLTPLSRPASTDIRAIAVMPIISSTLLVSFAVIPNR